MNANTTTAPAFCLRVLTLNIHKGFTSFNRQFILPELRSALRSVDADLVFLQEVVGHHTQYRPRMANYSNGSQSEFLAHNVWPHIAYGRNAVYANGDHGNAVLSKFPIVRFENHDASISGPERRGLLHCELRLPGQRASAHAICLHLSLTEAHRTKQLSQLCRLVYSHVPAHAPLIVAGDFNDWRHRASAQLASSAGLREVFVHANGQPARTFPAYMPLLPLDRIYVRSAASHTPTVLPNMPWARLSDHAPLAAEIYF